MPADPDDELDDETRALLDGILADLDPADLVAIDLADDLDLLGFYDDVEPDL